MTSSAEAGLRHVTADVIRDTDHGPRLVGSKCASCSAVTFPAQRSCPRCLADDVVDHELAPVGSLWGFTIQGFAPKEPYLAADAPFEPYGVGYVDLGSEVLVEARILAAAPAELRIGMSLELVVVPFHTSDDGGQALTYAFAPLTEEDR